MTPLTLETRRSPDKCTNPIRSPEAIRATRYLQRELGGGINSWLFDYENDAYVVKSWVGCGLEIAVQLRGEWHHEIGRRNAFSVGPRGIVRLAMGERYRIAYRSPGSRSRQVGFIVCEDALDALSGLDGELQFRSDAGYRDEELVQAAEAYAESVERRTTPTFDVRDVVKAYVLRHAELAPPSGLLRAKRELERHFTCDLPMSHLADIAGMHSDTLTRRFRESYGTSPAAYRIALRINHASRRSWQRPGQPLHAIAEECGFRSLSYFHRTFASAFGMSPAKARARFVDAERSLSCA